MNLSQVVLNVHLKRSLPRAPKRDIFRAQFYEMRCVSYILLKLKYKIIFSYFKWFLTFFSFLTNLNHFIYYLFQIIQLRLQNKTYMFLVHLLHSSFTLPNYFINYFYHNNTTIFILRVNQNSFIIIVIFLFVYKKVKHGHPGTRSCTDSFFWVSYFWV